MLGIRVLFCRILLLPFPFACDKLKTFFDGTGILLCLVINLGSS